MWLLVADFVRRVYRWPVLTAVLIACVLWWATSVAGDLAFAFTASIGLTFVIGPMMTTASASRVVFYLPVSRGEVWRATWFVSTVVAAAVATAIKLPALLAGLDVRDGGLAILALSSTYDFVAAAVGCSLMTFTQRPPDADRPWRTRLLALLAVVGFIGGALALLSLQAGMATRWSELTAGDAAALATLLALAIAGFAAGPHAGAGSPRLRRVRDGSRPPRGASRISGLPQLLLQEFVWITSMAFVLGTAFGVIAFLGTAFFGERPEGIVDFLRSQKLLIFEGGPLTMDRKGPAGLLVWCAFFAASVGARFPDLLRHLRVVPIGTTPLLALLVVWPAAFWSVVWAALIALSAAVAGTADALHPDLWLQVVGLSVAAQSIALWTPARSRWLFYSSPMLLVLVMQLVNAAPPAFGVLLAFGSIAAGTALTRAALARSSTYATVPAFELQAAP
jgi:hypothetical protein